jgi:hypothetical protein
MQSAVGRGTNKRGMGKKDKREKAPSLALGVRNRSPDLGLLNTSGSLLNLEAWGEGRV